MVIADNLENTDAEMHYTVNGGRWWPLSQVQPGTEVADLAANGDFEQASEPDAAGRLQTAEGWTRVGPAFVEPPVRPFPDARVMVARPGVDGAPVGQYWRGVALQPDTEYVLSAYLWNFSTPERHARVLVDLLGVRSTSLIAMPGTPGAGGMFAMMPFTTKDTGTAVTLRAWYDLPVGWTGDAPALQIARLALTPRAEFRPPKPREP
ncbi:MAG: hypothetical protein HYU66_17640 [Armatimonadetes bacterium]|nr:hypothetical protein [Armatimonadota bacterium]